MKKLTTHLHVDLDNCACAFALGAKGDEIVYVKAGATELPPESNATEVWDIVAGKKGNHDAECSEQECAFAQLVREKGMDICPSLIHEINQQDTTGTSTPTFSLAEILSGFRACGHDDAQIVDFMGGIFAAIQKNYENKKHALEEFKNCRKVETASGLMLIILDGPCPGAASIAQERCFFGKIYQDGFNMGIARYPGVDSPSLKRLSHYLPQEDGWFFHPTGFLAARGSWKNPAEDMGVITLNELIRIVQEHL